jgi:RNA polymerase sigma-70 factor (ECF subfamily)
MTTHLDSADERELVCRAVTGDEDAFAVLVRAHQQTVYNIAYRMVGQRETAFDLAQETFLRAFKALDRFDQHRPFGPWLYRIATNLSINWVKRVRVPTVSIERPVQYGGDVAPLDIPDSSQEPASRFAQAEQQAQLREAILGLPPDYRVVIELRHFQDLTYDEMAKELDVPMGTVKARLFRARRMLRDRLSAWGVDRR